MTGIEEVVNATASLMVEKLRKGKASNAVVDAGVVDIPLPEGGVAFEVDSSTHPLTKERLDYLNNHTVNVPTSGDTAVAVEEKQTIKEKVENTMATVKETVTGTVVAGKDAVVGAITSPFKKAYTWTKDKLVAGIKFLGNKKTAIAVGSASVAAGGLVTASCLGAMVVGTALAVAVVSASHAMQKKKEQKLAYKDMLTDMGVAVGTVAIMPLALLVFSYVGLYATAYGAILPYAIIVA